MKRARALHGGDAARCDVWELEVDPDEVEGFPRSGGCGYLRFRSCRVVERVFGVAPVVLDETPRRSPDEIWRDRCAQLRVDAIRQGRRDVPPADSEHWLDRRVLELLATQ